MKPKIVVLAGGSGTRFAPFTTNKTMWSFMGTPLIGHVLNRVKAAGFTEVIVVTNTANDTYIKETFSSHFSLKTHIQDTSAGMADALALVARDLGPDPIIVLNGVDMIDTDLLRRLGDRVQSTSEKCILVGLHKSGHHPLGYLKITDERVVKVIEKPSPAEQPSEVVKLTVDFFSNAHDLISRFGQYSGDDVYERAVDVLISEEQSVGYQPYDGYWAKLKYPHFVLDVQDLLLAHEVKAHVSPTATVSPHAYIEGDVYIDEGARIDAGAVIKGPCYIGKGAMVGSHTLVRSSIIEARTIVGFGSEVSRSYVGPGCALHHSFVGDSVLESEVNMSWGTVTANLRLDHKPVKITLPTGSRLDTGRPKLGALIGKGAFLGVQVSTMPGAIIAPGMHIAPQSIVK